MLSFGIVVAANNLLALKDFNTFLFNYEIHERPGFLERMLIRWAKDWIEKAALKQFEDLKIEVKPDVINVSLNDCPTGMFTVLTLAHQQTQGILEKNRLKTGNEIFLSISQLQLEFEKVKRGVRSEPTSTKQEG